MFNKNFKKVAAAAMSAAVLMGGGAAVLSNVTSAVASEAEGEEEKSVSLSIAGSAQESDGEEADAGEAAQEETEVQTEKKVEYGQLETTKTEGHTVTAVDVSDIVEETMPSVVAITTRSLQDIHSYFYGMQQYEAEGRGSGFIIAQNDDELLIATNNHVVDDSTSLTVGFSVDAEDEDDLLVPAVVKGTSPRYDLAVVAVKLSDIKEDVFNQLKIATLGSSDDLKIGEAAILIGNALGDGQTVSTGVVSALEHEIMTESGTFKEFQIDAGVNLGCSGGPILDGDGKVIGIFNAKAVADYAESMGYGIPVDTAIPVLSDMINMTTREAVENHGYLGVTVVPVSEEAKTMYGMPEGAYVYDFADDSPAEQAGMKKGDIIVKLDGREVNSSDALIEAISLYEAGETVKVTYMSNDGNGYVEKEVEVTLKEGEQPEGQEAQEQQPEQQQEQPEQENREEQPEENREQDNGYGYDPFDDFSQFFFGDGFGRDRDGNGNW